MLIKEHGSKYIVTVVDSFNDSPKKCISMLISILGNNAAPEKQVQADFEAKNVDEAIEQLSMTFDFENEKTKEKIKEDLMKYFTK